jgi:carbon-monoxide dehydrogenase medium subunit
LLVDIRKLKDLDRIRISDDGVRLGARVRWCDIEADARLSAAHPLLVEAVRHVAHYQIRNRGTAGGSICHADPAAEMPGIAVTCDAEMTIFGSTGTRVEKAVDFFKGALVTSLKPDDVLTEIRLPPWPSGRRWAFLEFARRRGDFAMAGVALFYDVDGRGRMENAHIGAIGVGDGPVRLGKAEAALDGHELTEDVISTASAAARESVNPPSDIHAPSEYRRALLGTLLERALRRSAA